MNHNNNTAHHDHPHPLNGLQSAVAGAEISNASGSNVRGLSNVRRIWLRCGHCDTVHAYEQQRLPLWCYICRRFNSRWGFLVTNEVVNYGWNFTNHDSNGQEWWGDWEHVELPENQNGTGGLNSIDDDFDHQEMWEDWENIQLPEIQNSNSTGGADIEGTLPNRLTEEIISIYLLTRGNGKSLKKDEGGDICVVCQSEFIEKEILIHLDCGHDYHYECIRQWLLHKNSCPLCIRTVIPPPNIEFDGD